MKTRKLALTLAFVGFMGINIDLGAFWDKCKNTIMSKGASTQTTETKSKQVKGKLENRSSKIEVIQQQIDRIQQRLNKKSSYYNMDEKQQKKLLELISETTKKKGAPNAGSRIK